MFKSVFIGVIAFILSLGSIIEGFKVGGIGGGLFILVGIGGIYFGYTCVRYLK